MLLAPAYVLVSALSALVGGLMGADVSTPTGFVTFAQGNTLGAALFVFATSVISLGLYSAFEAGLSAYLYRGLKPADAAGLSLDRLGRAGLNHAAPMAPSRPYIADLLRLAGPVALARLGIIGMALVDVVVVGQLAPDELPHQALGWAPTAVFLVAAIGLLQGVQVLAARALGEKKPEGAGVALRRGLVLALVAGLVSAAAMWLGGERIFTAFGIAEELAGAFRASNGGARALDPAAPCSTSPATYFLEAIKKPAASTIMMWLANGVNLALNLWWVPEHGAVGSAWATVGARVFLAGALLIWIVLLRDGASSTACARSARPRPRGRAIARCWRWASRRR